MKWLKYLKPPEFKEPQDQLRAHIMLIILLTLILASILASINIYTTGQSRESWKPTILRLFISGLLNILALILFYKRKLSPAGMVSLLSLLFFVGFQMSDYQGIHDVVVLLYPLLFIIASLLLRRREYYVFITLSLFSIIWIGWQEMKGTLTSPVIAVYYQNGFVLAELISIIIILLLGATGIHLIIQNMLTYLNRAQINEKALQEANRLLDRRVQERTDELQAANRELEAFAYSVSHDLRAPLRSISIFSRILREDYCTQLSVEIQDYLERINTSAIRMDNLICHLLEFSRLSRQPLHKTPIDLTQLVKQVVEELQSEKMNQNAIISIGKLPRGYGDQSLMRQVFMNLLSNAFKYSRFQNPPQIEIGYQHSGNRVVYFVRDNGVGFDMKFVDKLFGVFQRLHSQAEFEGTGIGLAIVRRIIQRHGGEVWAEGKVGEGATFYLTLSD
ncbi:hypothetical protein JW964_06315 [candidate division KSB1 bacterium]|nr:hypothetical protein [candidate division KSB1 bacterium]